MTVERLTPISDDELLNQVKDAIGMGGNNYNDKTIRIWVGEVKQYLLEAGVNAEVLRSTLAVGCIARGVDDVWVSHRDSYSEMFYSSAEVLRSVKVEGAAI